MTSGNGREPIDQRLDRLAETVAELVRASEQQRRSIEGIRSVVVEDGRRFAEIDARLERLEHITANLAQASSEQRQLAEEQRQSIEAHERRLQGLEQGRQS